ncbi:conserved exported hypothetical protein [Tenacibaculum sediminilitoris]|uniref:hypothetical protein n=1 Tax=Tenacibaculum sediminilitoris TaxID=1820334 RepID=UPI003896671F
MENKLLALLVMLFISAFSNAQISIYDAVQTGKEIAKDEKKPNELPPKLIQTAELGMSLPTKINYDFIDGDFTGKELKRRLSFDLFYNIGYPILKKLTLGAVAGVQHQSQGSITALKLGGSLRYYLKNYEGVNFYLLITRGFGISSNVKNEAGNGNMRLGIQFPIKELTDFDNFRVVFNIFLDHDSYELKEPLINSETPDDIVYRRGYGLAIGLQF